MKQLLPIHLISICALLFSCQTTEKIELSLNPLFSDHMVLQQNEEVTFWGNYTPGQKVTVSASWESENLAIPDEDGNWKLKMPSPEAGGPFEISIVTQDSTIKLSDVMIGEVWIASGQSNMGMPLNGYMPNEPIDNYEEEIANAKYPEIRMFTVQNNLSKTKLDTMVGDWQSCTPETAGAFSAAGYFFARKLHRILNIPIGIINTSWGGTEAEAWTSKEGLSEFPEFIEEIENATDETIIKAWIAQYETKTRPTSLEALENLDLDDANITDREYDDSTWPTITLPHEGCVSENFIQGATSSYPLSGFFWYRKIIQIEDVQSDYTLKIGGVNDVDVTYFNGQKVGTTYGPQVKRTYTIPQSILKRGENTIAIKHFDAGGASEVDGPILLSNGQGDDINLEGEWSGLFYGDITNSDVIIYGEEHQSKLKDKPKKVDFSPNNLASSLFNAMIHPLISYNIKGAIWYQGESNVGRAEQYASLFPAMIQDWRNHWQREFPFYFVQIAPFSYGNELSPALRDAQRKSLTVPKTGMAVTMDIGKPRSIHPGNKQDVGDRLALLALKNDYGQDIVASGPHYKSHQQVGNKIIIQFDSVGSGLMMRDGKSTDFEIGGEDKVFHSAKAVIINNKIEVHSSKVNKPVYVRYGWQDYLKGSLFNKEGLPASSFTSEN